MWQKYIYLGSILSGRAQSAILAHPSSQTLNIIIGYLMWTGMKYIFKKKKKYDAGERSKMCRVYLMLDVVSNCCWAKMQDVVSV